MRAGNRLDAGGEEELERGEGRSGGEARGEEGEGLRREWK